MKRSNLLIVLIITIVSLSATSMVKASPELDLQSGENAGFWHPQETITIAFPDAQIQQLNQTIIVELDSIDISAMLEATDNGVGFTPLQPLSPGQHELRVVEYSEQGDIEELGYWSIEVRQSRLIQDYQVVANTQAIVNYRIDDNNIDVPAPDSLHTQAISQVGFTTNSGNWRTSGQFDLYYDSLTSNRIDNRATNNNDFLFTVGNDTVEAKLGHQSMAVTSMIMDSFMRRGVSLESKIPSINSRISGFSLSSPNIVGFGNGLGISNSQQRVEGATFDSSPFAEEPRSLYITGTWLKGRSMSNDPFIATLDPLQLSGIESEAWSFSSESLLFENRLRIRAEYAKTDYDFDITDSLESDEDDAYSFLVTYNDVVDSSIAWNVGASSQKIGTFFRSIANQSLPSDKQINKFFAGTQWSTFGIQTTIERQKDNVEKIDILPRINTDLTSLAFNWSPQVENFDAWYGAPNFSLTTNYQSQLQTFTPTNFQFAETNNDIDNWQLSSQFSYQSNSWGLALTATDFTDYSLLQSNSETLSLDLFASFIFGEDSGVSLSPVISFNNTEDTSNQIKSKSISYALQSAITIIPRELDTSLSINWNANEVGNNLVDGDNLAAMFAINWIVREAKINQFGISLNLSSSYNEFNDNLVALNSSETQQSYLSVTVTFPYNAGQTNE